MSHWGSDGCLNLASLHLSPHPFQEAIPLTLVANQLRFVRDQDGQNVSIDPDLYPIAASTSTVHRILLFLHPFAVLCID